MILAKIIGGVCLMMAALSAAFAQASGPRVDLSLIVKDKENQSISTLGKEDVRIFEDGVEQTILSVEKDERPVDLGIAIDSSGSFRKFLGAGVTTAKSILGFTTDLDESSSSPSISPRDKAEKLLKSIAEESGGRVFFPRDTDQLMNATLQFISDLATQFHVTYQSSNADPKKTFRKVEVKVTSPDGEKRTAIVPRGYSVQAQPTEKKSP